MLHILENINKETKQLEKKLKKLLSSMKSIIYNQAHDQQIYMKCN